MELLSVSCTSAGETSTECRRASEEISSRDVKSVTGRDSSLDVCPLQPKTPLCESSFVSDTFEECEIAFQDTKLGVIGSQDGSESKIDMIVLALKENRLESAELLLKQACCDPEVINDVNKTDGTGHSAYYYAIRTGNVKVLESLVEIAGKLKRNEYEKAVADAFEELCTRCVPVSLEMERYICYLLMTSNFQQSEIINQRSSSADNYNNLVILRIDAVVDSINILVTQYCAIASCVDQRFLYVARFIAKNVYILKRKLKSLYLRLPWEEIEFCLEEFIISQSSKKKLYHSVMTKETLLKHLQNFAGQLRKEINYVKKSGELKLKQLPRPRGRWLKREEARKLQLQFRDLHKDYDTMRDIHSLRSIVIDVNIALSSDCTTKEGQLVYFRALQSVGECLKNTLESPKMSSGTMFLLKTWMPKNVHYLLTTLRDHLAHNELTEDVLWTGIKKDLRTVHAAAYRAIFYKQRQLLDTLYSKVLTEQDECRLREYATFLNKTNLDGEMTPLFSKNNITGDWNETEVMLAEIREILGVKGSALKGTLDAIEKLIRQEKDKSKERILNFTKMLLGTVIFIDTVDHIKDWKERVKESLPVLKEGHESDVRKRLLELVTLVRRGVSQDCIVDDEKENAVNLICHKIELIHQVKSGLLENLEELKDNFFKGPGCHIDTSEEYSKPAAHHTDTTTDRTKAINFLHTFLNEQGVIGSDNERKNFAIELLDASSAILEASLLETMADLENENNLHLLDSNIPQVCRKELRNYLAHGNALLHVLPAKAATAVLINAIILAENVPSVVTVKYCFSDCAELLKDVFGKGLACVTTQQDLYLAIEEGDFLRFNHQIQRGADIFGVGSNGFTSLHYAAKGPDMRILQALLGVMKFVRYRDGRGQLPLHVAAAHGNLGAIRELLKFDGGSINETDLGGRTALHLACIYGQEGSIKCLMDNGSNGKLRDYTRFRAVIYAIRSLVSVHVLLYMTRESSMTLLQMVQQQYTCLHTAAEYGHLELVQFLVDNGADVHARTVRNWTPLHAATWSGNFEVAKLLVSCGADVNAKVSGNGCPLHFAIRRCGHAKMIELLLKGGAEVGKHDDSLGGNTPLHLAVEGGYEDIVEIVLSYGADVHALNRRGSTPLHAAALGGHIRILRMLVERGADVCAADLTGRTPVICSIQSSQTDVLQALIDAGVDLNNSGGRSSSAPLIHAIYSGRRDVVKLLLLNGADVNAGSFPACVAAICSQSESFLEFAKRLGGGGPFPAHEEKPHPLVLEIFRDIIDHGADVHFRNIAGMTPVHVASWFGHIDMLVILVERGADPTESVTNEGFSCLQLAAICGHYDIVEYLLNKGVDEDVSAALNWAIAIGPYWSSVQGETMASILKPPIWGNQKKVLRALLKAGADINACDGCGRTPLINGAVTNNRSAVQFLLDNGADVNACGTSKLGLEDASGVVLVNPLQIAAYKGYTEIVQILVDSGAPVDDVYNKRTLLHYAAFNDLYCLAKCLVTAGADVNTATGVDGCTALHYAAKNQNSKMLSLLLERTKDTESRDWDDRVALHLAIPHLESVEVLLRHGADINCKSGLNNWTALHITAQEGNADLARFLVDHGADVNLTNDLCSTALHIAAREGNLDVVKFFVGAGMDVNQPGSCGRTLPHYAVRTDKIEVLEYLISLPVDVNKLDYPGMTPLLRATSIGNEKAMEVLVNNGALYDKGILNVCTAHLLICPSTRRLWATHRLFEVVKRDKHVQVERLIKDYGAFANAVNIKSWTPLSIAALMGYKGTADALLRNGADPNIAANSGLSPLHIAAKRGNVGLVRLLLCSGAKFDSFSVTDNRRPVDMTTDPSVIFLLELVHSSFEKVAADDLSVLQDLKDLNDLEKAKCVLRARNRAGNSIFEEACVSKFSEMFKLQHLFREETCLDLTYGEAYLEEEKYVEAERTYRRTLNKREKMSGPDSLDDAQIQLDLAWALYKQQKYDKALEQFMDAYKRYKSKVGGETYALGAYGYVALVLHKQGRNEEAMKIFEDIIPKLSHQLGFDHDCTLAAMQNSVLVLVELRRFDEASKRNDILYKKRLDKHGPHHKLTLTAKSSVAQVLGEQERHLEAYQCYKDIYKQRARYIGRFHSDTMRTLMNIGCCLIELRELDDAIRILEKAFKRQERYLGPDNRDTIYAKFRLAEAYYMDGNPLKGQELAMELFPRATAVLGSEHPEIIAMKNTINMARFITVMNPMWRGKCLVRF